MTAAAGNETDLSRRIRVTPSSSDPPAARLHSMADVRADLDLLKQRARAAQHARQQRQTRDDASAGPYADAAAATASVAATAVPVSAVAHSAAAELRLPADLSAMPLSAIQSLHARLRDQILNELQVELATPDQRFDAVVRDGFRELDAARTQTHAGEQQTSEQQQRLTSRPSHLRVHVTNDGGHSEGHPSPATSSKSRSDSVASTPAARSRASSGAHMRQLMTQHALLTPASAARAQKLAAHPTVRQLTQLLSPKSASARGAFSPSSFSSSPTAAPPRVSSPLYCGGGHRFDRFLSPPPATSAASATPPAAAHGDVDATSHHRSNRPTSQYAPAAQNVLAAQFIVSPPSPGWSAASPSPCPPAAHASPHQSLPGSRQGSASRRRNLRSPSPSATTSATLHPPHPPRLLFVYPPSTPSSCAASPAALHSPAVGTRASTAGSAAGAAAAQASLMQWQQQKQKQQHNPHPRSFRAPTTPASAPTTGRVGFDFKTAAAHRPTHSMAVPHLPALVSPSAFLRSPTSAEVFLTSPQPPSQPQRPSVARPHTESMGRRAHVMRARAQAEGQQAMRSQTAAPTGATSPFRMRRMRSTGQTQTQMRHTAQPTIPSPLRHSNWTDDGLHVPHSSDVAASSLHSFSNGDHALVAASHRGYVSARKTAAATDSPTDDPDSLHPTQLSESPPRQSLFAVRRGASATSPLSRASLQRPPSLAPAPEHSHPLHHDAHMQQIAEGDEIAAALLSARLARGLGSGNHSGASISTMRSPAVSSRPLQLGSHIFRQHVAPSSSGDTRPVGTGNMARPSLSRSESVSEIEEQLEMAPADLDDAFDPAPSGRGFQLPARGGLVYSDRGLEHELIPFPARSRRRSNVQFEDDVFSESSASEIEEEDQLRRM